MKFVGKSLIFMALLAGVNARGAEVQEATQEKLDRALLEAVVTESSTTIEELVRQKADPNGWVDNGKGYDATTPFLKTVRCGRADVVDLLLNQRADPNGAMWLYEHNGEPLAMSEEPLSEDLEIIAGHIRSWPKRRDIEPYLKIEELLLQHGAHPNTDYCFCLSFIIDSSKSFDCSPFYKAIALLLEYGADDTEKDHASKETIHDFAAKNSQLQDILNPHLEKRRLKVTKAITGTDTALIPETIGVVAEYVI